FLRRRMDLRLISSDQKVISVFRAKTRQLVAYTAGRSRHDCKSPALRHLRTLLPDQQGSVFVKHSETYQKPLSGCETHLRTVGSKLCSGRISSVALSRCRSLHRKEVSVCAPTARAST